MTDFLYLIRNDHNPMEGRSEAEIGGVMAAWGQWMGGLQAEGRLKGGNPLDFGAATLHADGSVTDGPHGSAEDFTVRGYLIITARNLDHAVETGRGCPAFAEGGRVEVHPIREM